MREQIDQRRFRSGDAWGGLASMLVALPSAIAFGVAVFGMLGPGAAATGALFGIVGTIALGLVAPLFGGTPRLISAPCAPAVMVLSAMVAELVAGGAISGGMGSIELVFGLLMVTILATGLLQLLFGFVKGGQLIKYIPYPVVAGYLSGVGIKIILDQAPRLFGIPAGVGFAAGLAQPGWELAPALATGLVTILIMFFAPKLTRRVPAPILALGAGLITYGLMTLFWPALATLAGNRLVIGPLSGEGFSIGQVLGRWRTILSIEPALIIQALGTALTLAVLLSIDTLKTCVIIDAITHSRHDSNRELRGQGLGNILAGLTGGMAGAGTSGATLVNIASGGKRRLSGFLAGVFALLAYLVLGPLVAWIPKAALAGILVVVGFRMIDRHSFHLLKRRSTYLDFVVIIMVAGLAVTVPLLYASGSGLALAIMLFLREQIRATVIRRKSYADQTFSRRKYLPEDFALLVEHGRETAICEVQGSLFFGTTDQLMNNLEKDISSCRRIILDMRRVASVDFTAIHILRQMEAMLTDHGGELILADCTRALPSGQDLSTYFEEVGLAGQDSRLRTFASLDEALEYGEDRVLEEADWFGKGHGAPLEIEELDLLKGLDATACVSLRAVMEAREIEPGGKLVQAGDTGDELFFIRKGTVRIVLCLADGRTRHLASFARGDCFGDMAFLDRQPRSADAVAATRTWLYVLTRSRFDELAVREPVLAREIFGRLACLLSHRLRQADAQMREMEEG